MIIIKTINNRLHALKDLNKPYTEKRPKANYCDGLALCGIGRKGETEAELLKRIKK